MTEDEKNAYWYCNDEIKQIRECATWEAYDILEEYEQRRQRQEKTTSK